jgi:NAD-dependent SIR2 family protein deacetylase
MNFCINCGNQLKSEAKFCSKCGQLVKEEVKPVPITPPRQTLCPKCGTLLVPGVKFCTSCGTPSQSIAAQPPPPGRPVAPTIAQVQAPLPLSAPPSVKPPKKKKGKKILVFAVSAITLLAAAAAAVYFFGTFEPTETYADLSALYEEEKYDQAKIDSSATAVETIFLNADTVKLAQILSPTTLEQKREFFGELQPHMAAFGQDFKTRKFLYGTSRFAVYEFSSAHGTFTAEFCLGEDGKWKLMRF